MAPISRWSNVKAFVDQKQIALDYIHVSGLSDNVINSAFANGQLSTIKNLLGLVHIPDTWKSCLYFCFPTTFTPKIAQNLFALLISIAFIFPFKLILGGITQQKRNDLP
jgi:hypothetical protein